MSFVNKGYKLQKVCPPHKLSKVGPILSSPSFRSSDEEHSILLDIQCSHNEVVPDLHDESHSQQQGFD